MKNVFRKSAVSVLLVGSLFVMAACEEMEEGFEIEATEVEEAKIEAPTPKAEKEEVVLILDDSIPDRDYTVGKSDKSFKDLFSTDPKKVRNDATEKWKIITIAETVDINEYVLSYSKEFFKEKDLLHVIVNFNTNTTTFITDDGDSYYVRTFEYVKGEEHDAKKLGGGMQLGEYSIYKDNGNVVDIEVAIESMIEEGEIED